MARAFYALVLGAVVATADAAPSRGAIAGTVWDLMGGQNPGTTITVSWESQRRSVVTGADGKYRIDALPPGTYEVRAELSGLHPVVADKVVVASDRDTECNFVMRVGPTAIVTHSLLDASLMDIAGAADAIVRIRIVDTVQPAAFRSIQSHLRYIATRYSAVVLAVLKSNAGVAAVQRTIRFRQVQAGAWGADGRPYALGDSGYRAGDELIAFLARDRDGQLIELEFGYFMFRIADEKISWGRAPSLDIPNGMAVQAFADLLRTPITITLTRGGDREQRTKRTLEELLMRYNLTRYTFTSRVAIEEGSINHAFPVLTLNVRFASQPDRLLSSYVHEQIHWHFRDRAQPLQAAIAELRRAYPNVPVGLPQGADTELGTYGHLLTCYLELVALRELLGPERAKAAIEGKGNYTWIYSTIFRDEASIAAVINRHGLQLK